MRGKGGRSLCITCLIGFVALYIYFFMCIWAVFELSMCKVSWPWFVSCSLEEFTNLMRGQLGARDMDTEIRDTFAVFRSDLIDIKLLRLMAHVCTSFQQSLFPRPPALAFCLDIPSAQLHSWMFFHTSLFSNLGGLLFSDLLQANVTHTLLEYRVEVLK